MRVSIDTNAYRAFADEDPIILEIMQEAETLAFSSIVLGELRAGFILGNRPEQNEAHLRLALARRRVVIHDVTEYTSQIYGRIWNDLRAIGRPIPTNDMWIAAQCLEQGFNLLTLDRHFEAIQGLRVLP